MCVLFLCVLVFVSDIWDYDDEDQVSCGRGLSPTLFLGHCVSYSTASELKVIIAYFVVIGVPQLSPDSCF